MAGTDIQAKVHAGLGRAIRRTGNASGVFVCTLRKQSTSGPQTPWDVISEGAPSDSDIRALDFDEQVRDAGGLIATNRRKLIVSATGAEPEKSDRIAVGVASADVDGNTVWHEVTEVRPLSPAGVDLLYEVYLAA